MSLPLSPVRLVNSDYDLALLTQDRCSVSRFIRDNRTFYEEPFLQLLGHALPEDGRIVDVGAHLGNHTVYFAGALGRSVVAVEPNPSSNELLQSNVALNGLADLVEIHSVAMGDRTTVGRLAPTAADDLGTMSLHAPTCSGGIDVDVRPLDDVVGKAGDPVALLKIDVEGAEAAVIAGARSLLERDGPIVTTEVQQVADVGRLQVILAPLGYRPVAVANPTPTVIWWPMRSRTVGAPPPGLITTGVEYAVGAAIRLNQLSSRLLRSDGEQDGAAPATGHLLFIAGGDLNDATGQMARAFSVVTGLHIGRAPDGRHVITSLTVRGPESGDRQSNTSRVGSSAEAELAALDVVRRDAVDADVLVFEWQLEHFRLAQRLVAALGIPYVIVFPDDAAKTPWSTWPFINGARRRLLAPTVEAEAWSNRTILDFETLDVGGAAETAAAVSAVAERRPYRPPGPVSARLDRRRVLLVSYYMPPCASVAMQRLSYWHDMLPVLGRQVGLELQLEVVTASEAVANDTRYRVVRDLELEHPVGGAAAELRADLQRLRVNHIGSTWAPYVESALRDIEPYDVAIISGNPFYYFSLARSLRAAGSRVLLDFRDPFARNPRIRYSSEQQAFLAELESSYVRDAEAVLSVNGTCLDLIAPDVEGPTRVALPNGYDERLFPAPSPTRPADGRVRFVYAGTFYRSCDPATFVSELDPSRHELVHVGRRGFEAPTIDGAACAHALGARPYGEVVELLSEQDVGLIFTSGDPFEQTTKIFDYIGAGLQIVIVTEGELRTGEIHRLTEGLPGIHWVKNRRDAIAAFLPQITPGGRVDRPTREDYSRRAQSRRLVELIAAPSQQENERA